ncbi:MAG: adenylate kinase family protein [Parcubacteria group bacterium Gr01-1014_44]|nr:MAG: adenylate kinase family protein [Parcubacteria group bacterium Gr01-1014_44]
MKAIFLMGPISSGKGTQADILAKKFGFFHFETSRFLVAQLSKPEFAKQKEQYDAGQWVDPNWVAEIVQEEIKKIIDQRWGLVFSGSPRTVDEIMKLLPFFEERIGKENLLFFNVNLSEGESIKRSISRRICRANGHPFPNFPEFQNMIVCPEDGSELIRKSLDQPELVSRRYQEHLSRTVPVFDFLKKQGYSILEVNGEQSIENVSRDIMKHLDFAQNEATSTVNP